MADRVGKKDLLKRYGFVAVTIVCGLVEVLIGEMDEFVLAEIGEKAHRIAPTS